MKDELLADTWFLLKGSFDVGPQEGGGGVEYRGLKCLVLVSCCFYSPCVVSIRCSAAHPQSNASGLSIRLNPYKP